MIFVRTVLTGLGTDPWRPRPLDVSHWEFKALS